MYYKYKCKDEIIKVWVWNTTYHKEVTVHTDKKPYDRTIREDSKGKFFTWNKEKIYLNDWVRMTMKELKEKIDRDEWVVSDDLTQAILTDGVENVRFECPLNPIDFVIGGVALCNASESVRTLCKVTEKRYKVENNYKLTVVPVDENLMVGSNNYYISDMIGLIKDGHIKIVV